MKRLVIGSMNKNAGKTSIIVGIAKLLDKEFGYMKPLGDRMLYKKKRQWDYDHALIHNIFGLEEKVESVTIGFSHSKLRFMYDEEGTKERLLEIVSELEKDKEVLFIEAGDDLVFGSSVNLDVRSIVQTIDAELIMVVSGGDDAILDRLDFLKNWAEEGNINLKGVIINQVKDVDDFKGSYVDMVEEIGLEILGILPYEKDMSNFTVGYMGDQLFAKVIAGEQGLTKTVENVFVGAMSAGAAMRDPNFKKPNKLLITSGDRNDLILAALDSSTSGIIVSNKLIPPANVLSKAHDMEIPILSLGYDTFETAKRIDELSPLMGKDEHVKIDLMTELVRNSVDLEKILE